MKLLLALALWGAVAYPVRTVKIVGGYPCRPHSVPWQVYFTTNGRHWCGGSLINKWWILSAAHCNSPANTLVAHLGKHDITQREGTEQNIRVARVIPHPRYNGNTKPLLNDIMLVKLAQPARINQYVAPIQLPSRCTTPGTRCQVSGWGDLVFRGNHPAILQCLKEPIIPDALCRVYPNYNTDMLCVGFIKGGKSTCQGHSQPTFFKSETWVHPQGFLWGTCNRDNGFSTVSFSFRGDSGGALVCNRQVQGIVSWGEGCAWRGYPSIYTKVCHYLRWIRQVMSTY